MAGKDLKPKEKASAGLMVEINQNLNIKETGLLPTRSDHAATAQRTHMRAHTHTQA